MPSTRLALANLAYPASREASVANAIEAIAQAGAAGAAIICFPECYLPGYRSATRTLLPPEAEWLEQAWARVATAAGEHGVAVVLGTERAVSGRPIPSALVIDERGTRLGFQDKVQIDPSEEGTYACGTERRVFTAGGMTFGITICHEGWRYPETVRAAVRQGAQVVFHPHFHEAEPGSYRPTTFADPANTFHEKALLCRAAENTCYVASVNVASAGSPTTSVVVDPDGNVVAWQPYGRPGVLLVDIELPTATGLLAHRYRPIALP